MSHRFSTHWVSRGGKDHWEDWRQNSYKAWMISRGSQSEIRLHVAEESMSFMYEDSSLQRGRR